MNEKAPAGFWTLILGVLSLAISALSMLSSQSKSDRDETRRLEQRLCRVEALNNMGECKR